MSKAYIFPGQGAQSVGMGKDLLGNPRAEAIFADADQALGFSLTQLMFDGPKQALDDTINTQPALYTISIALYEALAPALPAFLAGNSFGEYAALYVAGVFSFAEGLKLVRERGRLMKAAGEQLPGGMAAIIGLDDATVHSLCAASDGVQVSNYNSPGQVVVSGKKEGVAAVMQAAKERKAKLVTALDVSIAAHSKLMETAVAEFSEFVNTTHFAAPRVPVIGNVNAKPLESAQDMRGELISQLTSAVQWTQSVEYMAAQGVDTFVEFGPGKVLTGLIKRTVKNARLVNISDLASLQQYQTQEQA